MSHDSDDDLPERFRHITKASDAEIRLRQKLYPDVSVVEDAKIQCTICLKDVKHVFLLKKKSYKHRILQVVVCKSCLQFYGDGDFSADEDGIDKYCRWCGQGGSLYVCSKCPSTFCKKCIKQNLERKFMLLVENDDWCCFICDPSPLYKLRALLWAVDQHLKNEKTKEEKAKKKLKSRPKGSSRSSLKPVHAAEMSEEYFQTYVDSAKLWLSGLMQKIDPADTATARFKDCSVLLENLNHPADLENLSTSLLNFVDLQIDAMDNFRKELLEGLAKITKKCQAQRQPPGCGESEHSNGCTEVTHVDRDDDLDATVDATNGNDVHSSHSASMDMFEDCGEKEDNSVDRPVIRLRSLSELMAPHVKDDAKAKRKPRRVSPEAIQLSSDDEDPNDNTRGRQSRGEKSKSKTNLIPNPKVLEKSSLELKHDSYMENSSRQESAPSTSKRDSKTSRLVENPKSKKCEENLRKGSTKNRDNVGSRSSSDASSDRSRRPNHEKDKGATVQPLFVTTSESELEVGVEPKKISSSSESQENNPKKENQTKVKSSKVASSTPRIAMKTSKSTSDSTSSTDPLSEGSGDECKINRSYFTDSDEDNKSKKIVTKKKRKTRPMSESDSSLDNLLKITKISSASKKSKKDTQKKGKTDKSRITDVSSDEDDFNITKLCDLRTLKAKRTMSSDSLTLSEDEPVKPKTNKKKSKKVNSVPDKLEDHYDPTNNLEREDQEEDEIEDLNTTFQREFAHINERSYVEDMTGDFLRLSSSDEEKGNLSPEEEQPKKRKRTKGPANTKEGRKGKKQYPDKLMKMKIDSDSDDLEQGEKKYEEHKKKQAGKNRKSSDEDVPKAKPGRPKRVAPRKKMFSDSDLSDDEAESEKEEVKKPSENGSGADSDFDAKAAQSSQKGSESDSGSIEVQPKKRKRIKRQSGSSSSDDDNDGGGKRQSKKDSLNDSRGRKNIKKILKEDDLKQTTQAALKAEQERKKRIEEKQKLYNQLMKPANELSAHTELSELVLDFDAKTKEKLVVVDSDLVKKLKPHQAEGVKFMWDSCFESLAMTKKKSGSGCILAHCMGLGKSLQVVTLVHTLITHEEIGVKKVMVVTPLSTVLNWVNEFDKWLKDVGSGQDVNVFHMNKTQPSYRSYLVKDWARQGGVLILGYNLLRALTNPKARMKPSFKKVFHENLLDPGPDVVICDEGHILKNEKTAINQCMTQIKTKRRIVLTGTPLQNNLVEYHCMVQFVKPNLLGTKKEFKNRFVNPITNGQFEDSTAHDVKIMKRRAHVLHTMLDGLVQRKDYSVLTPYLPPKYEFVIHLKLSDVQVKLYRHYLLNVVHGGSDTSEAPKGKRLFVDFQNLMWICLHPRTLLMKADKDEKKAFMEESDEEGSLKDFIDDDKSTSESDFKTSSSSESESSVKSVEKPTRKKTRRQGSVSDDEPAPPPRQWWTDLIEEANMDDIKSSSKLFLFFTILKYCEEIGDKLLVFSQSLYTLDIIEYFLDKIDVETQKPEEERCPGIKGFEGNWAKGQDYFRLDGSSACENRESWCKSFNVGENRARLFLISTRAGGLGINLTGANRVIIFDASWNPSFDVQSLFRIYRFGQDKPCYIYRFLSKGTMEEKVYERQVAKLSTSLRVIDEHQIDRHFSHSALAELYMFNPEGSELQGTPLLPKDRLMADLLSMHGDIILSYHQHDSLLQNQEDQELTEEERKAAWTEFENEKNQVPQPGFSLGIVASMMAEIRAKLKQLNPNMTEEQIHAMAIDAFQRLPDYPAMAPYVNVFQQQMSMMQQARAQGMLVGTNPMFPGLRMPSFQYPQFNNSQAAMLANMNAMKRMNNPDPNQLRPPSFNFQQLLDNYTNPATSNASMVANPKHTSGPVIQSTTSLQPRAAAGSSTSAGDNDVVVLD